MTINKLLLSAVLILLPALAQAELICVKKKIKASKTGQVAMAKAFKTTTDTSCPTAYLPVLDTNLMQMSGVPGPKGD